MTLVVPDIAKNNALSALLNKPNIKLKLFSNNVTPVAGSTNASFTEVAGGGYAAVVLVFANWVIANGIATYNAAITFTFSGVTNAPGTIYGYWIVDDNDSTFLWAENLPTVPYTPIAGSTGKITPRITG